MKRRLAGLTLICLSIGTISLLCFLPSTAFAARKQCDGETDTGNRIKCKMENLTDSFDSFVATVSSDDTGTFSENQKKQLENLRNQVHNEVGRTPPEDFKQMGKKHDVECYIQEILGDVTEQNDLNDNGECDEDEDCIGNEDGICDPNERNQNGCAEILNDGIGDDDGVCEVKGKYDEACIEVCDVDVTMAVGDETNVDRGKADEVEQALEDATDVVDEAGAAIATLIKAHRASAKDACDRNNMAACEYLGCLMSNERKYTANEIEGTVGGAIAAKLIADSCRDAAKWDVFTNYSAVCAIPGLIQSGLQIAAVVLEVKDDSQTSERIDAIGECMQETSGQVQAMKANLHKVIYFLKTPPGKRGGYPGE